MRKEIKILAYYLPQYHQIKENDEWWGTGFTEWTNVRKAKPLFDGHKQPVVPGELGYYDLMHNHEIQEKQAALALDYGVDGFIYYQYWFGNGRMLLEKPAEKMLKNKNIKLPFCFCWANETWSGIWHGLEDQILIEQKYPGKEDYVNYFEYLLPFFCDERYIKIENKPMFHIYRMDDIPDWDEFSGIFNQLAIENGFSGIYFVSTIRSGSRNTYADKRIYAMVDVDGFRKLRYSRSNPLDNSIWNRLKIKASIFFKKIFGLKKQEGPLVIDYLRGLNKYKENIHNKKYVPCVVPNWDNSPRSGRRSLILTNSNPQAFEKYFSLSMAEYCTHKENPPFVVIKSWNEWGEGNYIEPDAIYGRKWLETVKKVKKSFC